MKEYNLETFLEKYSNMTVDFFRFNGNYGDSLIWHGTMMLLNRLSINVNYVDIDSRIENNILFIDGGGNFIDNYSDVRNFLALKHKKYKEIIILPHTISGVKQKKILKELGSNTTIFCREKVSFDFVKDNSDHAYCYLSQDCAFYNNISSYKKIGKGVLSAFRNDSESIFNNKPDNNIDISYDGWCKKPLDNFFEKISDHEEIKTDRLHVAIAGTMLRKKVQLFPNTYYKNLAVYEYSLKKYPDTSFIYAQDSNLVTFKNVDKSFKNFLQNKNGSQRTHTILDLFQEIIEINFEIWNLEDRARDTRHSFQIIAETKKQIDKCNQYRNDTIRKIDLNFAYLLGNNEELEAHQFISESPGMLIDRLSIFYIRKSVIFKILDLIKDDTDLFKIYEKKLHVISEQIEFLGKYADILISGLRGKRLFFKIFRPVKIYNDHRIRKYIDALQK